MELSIPFGAKPEKISENIFRKPIDSTVPSMVEYGQMTEAQSLIAELKTNGWGNTSIARAIGVTVNSVEKWQADNRNISRSHLILLRQLLSKKPPRKRHSDRNGKRLSS